MMKRLLHPGAAFLAAVLSSFPLARAETVQVTGPISTSTRWMAVNEYVLNGFVYVVSGAELWIEAGTVIKGKPGQDAAASALIVAQGGKIYAEGTPTRPIIFTAEADEVSDPEDLSLFQRGLWGGVVLLGKATLNTTVNTAGNAATPKYEVFEGLPDTVINGQKVNRFGGSDDNDSSGVMRFVSIRHAGIVFAPNKELNGLSLGGVGRGTVLEYIETYATADDGYEFFGGTVNTKYLVSAFNDDDAFDVDMGWRGKNQFWFAIQEPGKKDSGGEWNGEPNEVNTGAQPTAAFEVYNATWIGAGTNTVGNRGLNIRVYAAPKVYNSILTEFGGNAVRLDDKSVAHLDSGLLDLRDNLFWNFATNGVAVPLAETSQAAVLFSDTARKNEAVNPQLRGISRAADGMLDPRPASGSPALTGARAVPADGFYTATTYKGAFGEHELWIDGWTFLAQKGFIPPRGQNVVHVRGAITDQRTWSRTNTYVLNGFVYVLQGAAVDIEAGTVIKAMPGQDANASALIVTRGGRINAAGTRVQPIIFTAEADDVDDPEDLPAFQRGLWGGVVLLGRARLNTTVDSSGNAADPKYEVFEGLPDTQVLGQFVNRFGGSDDNDSSGVMRYVSIRHAGIVFAPNKELNGLSLGGVGRGTVLEYIETYATADDGFEFFGGTVNTKYLVSAFNDDDAFDVDMGWRRKNQFWFAIQESAKKDSGGEWNGEPNEVNTGAQPTAAFEVYNATWIGAGTNTVGNRGLNIRVYAAPKVYNSILTEFGGNAVRLDDKSVAHLESGLLDLRDNLFWNFATNGVPVPLAETSQAAVLFSDTARKNEAVNPQLRGISRTADGMLDPRPAPGSPALTGARAVPADGFYAAAAYKGAFLEKNWLADWTFLASKGYVQGLHGVPVAGVILPPTPPMLDAAVSGGEFVLSFSSESGRGYRVQSTAELVGGGTLWANEGDVLMGTGSVLEFTSLPSAARKFYRVVVVE